MWLTSRLVVPLSLCGNIAAALFAFLMFWHKFSGNVHLCYLVAVATALGASACLSVFALHDYRLGEVMAALIGHAVALIFIFAGIFRGYGLTRGSDVGPVPGDIGLYFSVVTWTTLGYGDFTPAPGLELIAALEAILGYVFFGLIVSLGVALIRR